MSLSRFFASGLLVLPLILTGCGDPCLDDGFVSGVCNKKKDETPAKPKEDKNTGNWCADTDLDGFGDPTNCKKEKPADKGWVENKDDCDDNDPSTHPGAAEKDSKTACMRDADLDGFGDDAPSNELVTPGTDCDDDSAVTFPGAASKEGDACMKDSDGDGFGDANPGGANGDGKDGAGDGNGGGDDKGGNGNGGNDEDDNGNGGSDQGKSKVVPGSDCDDTEANTFPGAAPNDDDKACMKDTDGDDWGDNNPPSYKGGTEIIPGTDCDDNNAETHTGAAEKELTDKCTKDADNDGFADNDPDQDDITPGTDCDDLENQTFPGASEKEAGDLAKACTKDSDEDGFADDSPSQDDISKGTDCNDTDDHIHPNAAEKELPGQCTKDHDEDGFGDFDDDNGKKKFKPGSDCDDNDPNSAVDCDKFKPLSLTVPSNYNIKLGESVVLAAKATGGSQSYSWAWTPATSLSDASIAQPTAKPTEHITYTVTVTDKSKKNSKSATVTIHVTDVSLNLGACLKTGLIDLFGGYKLDDGKPDSELKDSRWTWDDTEKELCQMENSQPTAVICKDWMLDNATVSGQFFASPDASKNLGTRDDDWVGMVWGVQPSMKQYYLMSWKGADQSGHSGCEEREGTFRAGIYIRRFDESKKEPLGCQPLVGTNNDQEATYTVLAKPTDFKVIKGSTNFAAQGWQADKNYRYELVHANERSILRIYNDDKSEGVEAEFIDSTPLERGHWGAFTMSQDSSCYVDLFTKAN